MDADYNSYFKVQSVIRDAKIKKYVKESDSISKAGISFWGAITGNNSLQLEKVKNIKLRIELLQTQKIQKKDEYDLIDMMADLYACAISDLGGKFTNEMQEIYDKMQKELCGHKNYSENTIYELACKKVNSGQTFLPVIHKENKIKGIFADTKVQINFYRLENKKLENQIILERGKGQFDTFTYTNKKNSIIPLKSQIFGTSAI